MSRKSKNPNYIDYKDDPTLQRWDSPKVMLATKAEHYLGELNSENPDICSIHSETNVAYYGNWITGYGFINLMFPKGTTRKLTEEEKKKWLEASFGGFSGSWKLKETDFA